MPDIKLLCPTVYNICMKHFKIHCGCMKINTEVTLIFSVKWQL
jgi:hypothetical protein